MKKYAKDDIYFQKWSSEILMQTVSVVDLKNEPLKSLYYLHIQPPVFDGIRAVFALLSSETKDRNLVRSVDQGIHGLWTMLYGIFATLFFYWLTKFTNKIYAFVSTCFFCISPQMIFYATTLEGTFLCTVIVFWLQFEIFRLSTYKNTTSWRLTAAICILFLSRSVFQWPSLIIIVVSLLLLKVQTRKIVLVTTVAGLLIGVFTAKQYLEFGVTYTSSFAAYNCCRSIGGCPDSKKKAVTSYDKEYAKKATVLNRKYNVQNYNYNHLRLLEHHKRMMNEYQTRIKSKSLLALSKSYIKNLEIYLEPSSTYTEHSLVDRLPWRGFYDYLFSGYLLCAMLVLASLSWIIRSEKANLIKAVGFILPVCATLCVCVLFERGENMRFKFFIEPLFFLFISNEIYQTASIIVAYTKKKIVHFKRLQS